MTRIQREMSRAQFKAALARHGFRQVLVWFEDTTGACPNVHFGALMHLSGKIARRATLAMIVRRRDEEVEKRASAPPSLSEVAQDWAQAEREWRARDDEDHPRRRCNDYWANSAGRR